MIYLVTILLLNFNLSKGLTQKQDFPNVNSISQNRIHFLKDSILENPYWHPEMTIKPEQYWNCEGVISNRNRNRLGESNIQSGLQYHLMCQSLAGLANRAVQQGKSKIGIWFNDPENRISYKVSKKALENLGIKELGLKSGLALVTDYYSPEAKVTSQLKNSINGFVLTDIEKNPESNLVASVAAHVYNSIIVDVRDQLYYEKVGYKMTYDARNKSTKEAWAEFKDKCNNKGLVIMPLQTGELREFAIANDLFVLNLKTKSNSIQNLDLLKEILKWLSPNSPVYGWEQGIGEDSFVDLISKSGNIMIPYDWAYNYSLTSILYKERQPGKVKSVNPKKIDFDAKNKKYVSFYLSDGDNVQWMMNSFSGSDYYSHPEAINMKMSFGVPVDNLSMIAPAMCQNLFDKQGLGTSIVQTFGGGYHYADLFGINTNRSKSLKKIAKYTAFHMKNHGIKVLALIAKKNRSAAAKQAYQAYISANDALEGVVSVQYSPYAGGEGEIMWFKNGKGIEIPVITVKYSIWDFGNTNKEREGAPDYIAEKLNYENAKEPFSLVAVHAWSKFSENNIGAGAVKLCANKLDKNIEIVNIEELIWRIRMKYQPEQTKIIINL